MNGYTAERIYIENRVVFLSLNIIVLRKSMALCIEKLEIRKWGYIKWNPPRKYY